MAQDDEPPPDPFRDETPYGPWHYSLRQGEMVLKALAELPDINRAIIAIKQMSRDDLEASSSSASTCSKPPREALPTPCPRSSTAG
jgi:hypothetical protein